MTIYEAQLALKPLLDGLLAGALTDEEKTDFANALKDFLEVPGAVEAIKLKSLLLLSVQQ